jgi:hypothetical protein
MSTCRKKGDLLQIAVGVNNFFGRVLEEPFVAFYEYKEADGEPSVDEIVARKIIFTIPTMKQAITQGRWKVIGNRPLSADLTAPIETFLQDRITGKLSILVGHVQRPASVEECLPLERAAVWEPEHVEDRLQDARLGRESRWVRQLSIKLN